MELSKEQQYWLENDFLAKLLKVLPAHVFWKNKHGVYLGCNDKFAQSLGFSSPDEIIGKTDYDLPPNKNDSAAYIADDQYVMDSGKPKLHIEEEQTFPDGRKLHLLTSKVPIFSKEGEVLGILGIYIDVTNLKETELALKNAKEEAEQSNELKSEFISNMQHDIRTPFVGVYSVVDLLARQETDAKKKVLLEQVTNCAKELMDYCNGILDFSRIESKSLPVINKSFRLRKIVESAITIEKMAALDKHLDLSLEYDDKLPPVVMGDSYRLKRILINLISNAIKFTESGFVKVFVSINSQEQIARHIVVKFTIEDSGIGIPDDKKALIYERFSKVTPSNKGTYKGLGLGLRIVKQFVEELDGDIHLKTQTNNGSKFVIFLPFKIPLSNEIIDE